MLNVRILKTNRLLLKYLVSILLLLQKILTDTEVSCSINNENNGTDV